MESVTCAHCGETGQPCPQALEMGQVSHNSLCLKWQGWTKGKKVWRCPECTAETCQIPAQPEHRPDCWRAGHPEGQWRSAQPPAEPTPEPSPSPATVAGEPTATVADDDDPHAELPPYQEVLTPEYIRALGLHGKMVRRYGKEYLNAMCQAMDEMGYFDMITLIEEMPRWYEDFSEQGWDRRTRGWHEDRGEQQGWGERTWHHWQGAGSQGASSSSQTWT